MKAIILTLMFASCAIPGHASERCSGRCKATNVTNTYSTVNEVKGVSAAIAASAHVFDPRSHGFQWSLGAATYGGEGGVSAAIGHRINDKGLFLNVSVSGSDGETGAAVGLRGQF